VRTIALTVMAFALSGCLTMPQRLSDAAVAKYRNVVVVPIEAPALLARPASDEDKAALQAADLVEPEGGGGSASSLLVDPHITAGVGLLASVAAGSVPRKGESLVLKDTPPPVWMPTGMLARSAAQLLQAAGETSASVIEGYAQLPVTDRSVNATMENWYAPVRRWYNSDVAMLDYRSRLPPGTDAVLEVGILNYAYRGGHLNLQLMVKVVDPRTQRVVARARDWKNPKGSHLDEMLENHGQALKDLIGSTANELLASTLRDVGLLRH